MKNNPTTQNIIKKIICFIFGHSWFTYDCGDYCSPEQAWGCNYCHRMNLEEEDSHWGWNLNNKVTKFLYEFKWNKKVNLDDEIPF